MDNKNYIASGILELYVAGVLTENEMSEVFSFLKENPEAQHEVEEIEKAIVALMDANTATSKDNFDSIMQKINSSNQSHKIEEAQAETKIIPIDKNKNWFSYIPWAASAILLLGLITFFVQKQNLQRENVVLNEKVQQIEGQMNENQQLMTILRDKDNIVVPLAGQEVDQNAYATVYWNKKSNRRIIKSKNEDLSVYCRFHNNMDRMQQCHSQGRRKTEASQYNLYFG